MSTTETTAERLRHDLDEMEADRDFWRQTAVELFDQCAPQSLVEEHLSETQIARLESALYAPEPVKQATLFWVTEGGERHKLAEDIFTDDTDENIRQHMFDHYWEGRLDSSSCSAVVEIEEFEP